MQNRLKDPGPLKIVLTNKTSLSGDTIRSLPSMKYIGVLATGYNVVDIRAARENGIVVTNIPAYGTQTVAQMVFAHLLGICHQISAHIEAVKKGEWTKRGDFCFWNYPLIELAGKTMGIIGMGRIGQVVARIRLFKIAIENLRSFPAGNPVNIVSQAPIP